MVSREKAREIIKEILDETSNSAVFVSKSLQDYSSTEKQSTENQLIINPLSKVSFNLVYEDSNKDLDLNKQKYITEIKSILDLRNISTHNLTASVYSPNYPGSYPNRVDMTWWIRAPDNLQVSLYIVDMEFEECCDRLKIYDGFSSQHLVIGDLTGNGTNINSDTFTSSSNDMYIWFTSDCSLVMRGFNGTIDITNSSLPDYQTTASITTAPRTTTSVVESCSAADYLYPQPYTS